MHETIKYKSAHDLINSVSDRNISIKESEKSLEKKLEIS